jgi:hypothetical protein
VKCAYCGRSFTPTRRGNRYCSGRCKVAAHRDSLDLAAMVKQAVPTGVELATTVRTHLSFGTTLDGDTDVQARLREIMHAYPKAFRTFGEPMIRATLATVVPKDGCRWDLARMYAIRLDQPKPRLSRAGRTLLGDPCPNCTRRMQPAKQQPKDSGGATRDDKRETAQRLRHHVARVASQDPRKQKVHDPFGTCSTCRDYRRTHPDAALTAGGLPKGLAPHAWNEPPRPPVWAR